MRKEEMMELPLSSKPSIITCIHQAYPCAIIESKELASIIIADKNKDKWCQTTQNTMVEEKNNRILIFQKEEMDNSATVLWKSCKCEEEIEIYIEYFKEMDNNRYIDIFLFDDLQEECLLQDKNFGIRWNQYGLFVKKEMYGYNTKIFRHIKFYRKNNSISCFVSMDGKEWSNFTNRKIPKEWEDFDLKIGIHFNFGFNTFCIWKKMNLIQLAYNTSDPCKGILLDYFVIPRKNYDNSYFWFSNYLETIYDTIYEISDLFTNIHEYIQWNIRHGYYVNIALDEFFVPERSSYKKEHYQHYNLFFGYDNYAKKYKIMGYGKQSKPFISELSYEELSEEIVTSEKIVRYKYVINNNVNMKFCISIITSGLRDFIMGENTSYKYANLLTEKPMIYGISIFPYLIENEQGRKEIRIDTRISFCILEHSKLMKERIDYLFKKKYISQEQYPRFDFLIMEINKLAEGLLKIIIKNKVKPIYDDRIDEMLKKLYNEYNTFCNELISTLA